ncbi:hypothetical protein EAE96_001753 [Botrytis aclada]|nr:hypothetical protein EAE96_001753 [Botrytis aclada]
MTEFSHGVRQATMGGLVKRIELGQPDTIHGMTAGHFVFEGTYKDGESSPVSDSDDESDEDVESFELELSFIEAKSKEENDLFVLDKSAFEVDGELNMGEWSRLGKLSKASHDLIEEGRNRDWGLITIDDSHYSLSNTISLDLNPALVDFGRGQSSVRMNCARRPLEGILHGSWSYIMLTPGKVLVRTYLLSLSDGLHDGDSGAWIVDSSDSTKVFGHVVASDVLGRGYVIPMNDTIKDILQMFAMYYSTSGSVILAHSTNLFYSNDTRTKHSPKGLMEGVKDHGSADDKYVPLSPRFGEPDFKHSTMEPTPSPPWPGKSPRLELQPPTMAKKHSNAKFFKPVNPSRFTAVSAIRRASHEDFGLDKEEMEREIALLKLEKV